jgi:hypothetical protein
VADFEQQQQQGGGQLPDPAATAQQLVETDPTWAGAVAEQILGLLEQQQQGGGQPQGQQDGPPPEAERQRGYNVTPARGRIAPGGR